MSNFTLETAIKIVLPIVAVYIIFSSPELLVSIMLLLAILGLARTPALTPQDLWSAFRYSKPIRKSKSFRKKNL